MVDIANSCWVDGWEMKEEDNYFHYDDKTSSFMMHCLSDYHLAAGDPKVQLGEKMYFHTGYYGFNTTTNEVLVNGDSPLM